jgi:hypothetical protein
MRQQTVNNRSPGYSITGIIAFLVFVSIAVFLIYYTWIPSEDSLTLESGRVVEVIKGRNTWYEATITTDSGVTLTCKARKNPLAWANRCPIEELEKIKDSKVDVMHNGKTPYVIKHGKATLLDMASHRKAQATGIVLAFMVLGMGYIGLRVS